MNSHGIVPHRRLNNRFVRAALLTALLAACALGFAAGAAQTPKKEREIEDKIPAHVPIKVKVKNLEKVKDLDNDGWLGDLEIEVTNTGTKPIYFLRLGLEFVDVKKDSGATIGYALQYGKARLIDLANRATAEDVPIEPGRAHVFKLHKDYVEGWQYYRTHVEKKPHPKKISIFFSVINYGDGTGYVTASGLPVPSAESD